MEVAYLESCALNHQLCTEGREDAEGDNLDRCRCVTDLYEEVRQEEQGRIELFQVDLEEGFRLCAAGRPSSTGGLLDFLEQVLAFLLWTALLRSEGVVLLFFHALVSAGPDGLRPDQICLFVVLEVDFIELDGVVILSNLLLLDGHLQT